MATAGGSRVSHAKQATKPFPGGKESGGIRLGWSVSALQVPLAATIYGEGDLPRARHKGTGGIQSGDL